MAIGQGTEELPGAEFYLDFGTGLEASDNYERLQNPSGTSLVWLNTLGLTFDSGTRNQRLIARGGFTFEAGYLADDPDEDGRGITSPFLSVDYTLQNRGSLLSFDASYAERDNGFDEIEIENANDIIVDQGTRSDLLLGVDLILGRDAPLTFTTELDYRDTQYFDTTDPDLDDETFYSADTVLSLSLNRTTELLFSASYTERDEDDARDTFETNSAASIGLSFRNSRGLSGVVSLGYSVNELTETIDGARETDRDDRPVASINLSQERPNGVIRTGINQNVNDQGRRTELTFGRDLTLPRATLSANLGVSVADYDESVRGIGSLRYTQDLPRGALALRFSQRVVDDSDEDGDTFITTAGMSYSRPLTSVSTFSFDLDLSASEGVDADEADNQRASVQMRYTRALTQDWALNTGIRHSTFRETDEDPIIENAIFARIERRFDLRP